jgi:hypothetical protein
VRLKVGNERWEWICVNRVVGILGKLKVFEGEWGGMGYVEKERKKWDVMNGGGLL